MFIDLSLLDIIWYTITIIVATGLLLFGFPRTIYAILFGCLSFAFPDYFSATIGIEGLVFLKTLISFFVVVGMILDTQWGRDNIFWDFVDCLKRNPISTFSSIIVIGTLGFFAMISFGLPNFFFELSVIVFIFLFFVLPRTSVLIIINWFLVKNAILIISSGGIFYTPYITSMVLIVVTLALDLPEARQFLWLINPRKKKQIVSFSTVQV